MNILNFFKEYIMLKYLKKRSKNDGIYFFIQGYKCSQKNFHSYFHIVGLGDDHVMFCSVSDRDISRDRACSQDHSNPLSYRSKKKMRWTITYFLRQLIKKKLLLEYLLKLPFGCLLFSFVRDLKIKKSQSSCSPFKVLKGRPFTHVWMPWYLSYWFSRCSSVTANTLRSVFGVVVFVKYA